LVPEYLIRFAGSGVKQRIVDIWERVLDGDPSAWEQLVLRYASLVYSVARHSGLTDGDAEDCAQQTWMALYNGRRSVREPAKLPAWLTSTAKRKAARLLRRKSRAEAAHESMGRAAAVAHPDEAIIRLQRKAQLELALEQLDERCGRLLRAVFLSPEGLSYEDIAHRLGMAPNSLGPTRSRCLKKLRKILIEMGYL
jgi:RNA polymerase sigma factor (sigma-70 family)